MSLAVACKIVCAYQLRSRQQFQHTLHLLVSRHPRLGARYAGIIRIPAQLLGHEFNGSLQDILSVVYEILRLVREGKGVQGF
jgi:hypothetical protein